MTHRRSVVLASLVIAAVWSMLAAAAAQQPAPGQAPPAGGGRGGGIASRMTGKIEVGDTKNMNMSRIRFEAGARTNWHIHSAAQLLLVEEGRGRLQELGSGIVDVPAGQPVLTKPNVLHWHGAAPDQAALQFSVYSGTLEWKDPVTDEQYLGKK
ncbi:MAG TPA: cupin domain-containing protein [Vicinamibacterales bacterium]|jgi:quercetin dioxygenase-like cupin family protein|nr:cupin domain-containing protein [Vicinamibacterales bacterium]